jgi:adenosine deaminase
MLLEMMNMNIEDFIYALPKAELHLHIEGTLEPQMMLDMAERNKVTIPYKSVQEIEDAKQFTNLQSFLDLYYAGASVLIHEQDFYDLTWAYLKKCYAQNVVYAEIFFDPQTHLFRGIPFCSIVDGINRACLDARDTLGIDTKLIMCFLRHLSEEGAFDTLIESLPYKDLIYGVGLDSSEVGNPPEKFKRVFAKAEQEGFALVAHAGEEGGPEYIWGALEHLKAERIDHGVRCDEDDDLVRTLIENDIPLTVCPLSNVRLRVFDKLEDHNLKTLLRRGVNVSVHSDDPAYFGGYLCENLIACHKALDLSKQDIIRLVRNSFKSAFIDGHTRDFYIDWMDNVINAYREVH